MDDLGYYHTFRCRGESASIPWISGFLTTLQGGMYLAVCTQSFALDEHIPDSFGRRPKLWVKIAYAFIRWLTIFHAGYVKY